MTRDYGIDPGYMNAGKRNIAQTTRRVSQKDKIKPMRQGWSARKALVFILGLAACCWAVFIVLLWGFS